MGRGKGKCRMWGACGVALRGHWVKAKTSKLKTVRWRNLNRGDRQGLSPEWLRIGEKRGGATTSGKSGGAAKKNHYEGGEVHGHGSLCDAASRSFGEGNGGILQEWMLANKERKK